MMSKTKQFLIYFAVISVLFIGFYGKHLKAVSVLDNHKEIVKDTTEISGELTDGVIVEQTFFRLYPKIDYLQYQFANFTTRPNEGRVLSEV